MGRGRAPCCEKEGLKKGPWAAEEDMKLVAYINMYGHGNWRALPKQAGLLRCGKSCRLRWINYLQPDLKRGNFTQEEKETIIRLHGLLGNKWSKIASCLPGRTDNEIKNVWNTNLKKQLVPKEPNPSTVASEELSKSTSSSSISSIPDCNQGKELTGDEEQEQPMIKSDSPPAACNMVQLENMKDPLEEILQWPLDEPSMDIWNMLGKNTETPSPSCSACSSYLTCSNQVDVKGEDQTHPLFKSKSPNDNDQEIAHMGVLEIPAEPDMDFWDMLGDEFCSFSRGGGAFIGKETHPNAATIDFNVDNRQLVYLENESGL